MTNLIYSLYGSDRAGVSGHPQKVMRELGIEYVACAGEALADAWCFWRCTNVLVPLPPYLREGSWDPDPYLSQDELALLRSFPEAE